MVYAHSEDSSQVAEALLSQLVKHVYGISNLATSPLPAKLIYYLSQGFTFAILVVAANTAYADFPRLAALHAGDGFLPSQFVSRGDRLVFSNGVIFLTVISLLPCLGLPRQPRPAAAPVRPGVCSWASPSARQGWWSTG